MYRVHMHSFRSSDDVTLSLFQVLSGNGRVILISKEYYSKDKCKETAEKFAKAGGFEFKVKQNA